MVDFGKLKKNLRQDFAGLKKIRLAILSDSASQLLTMAIRGYGYEIGYDLEIYEAPYDQIEHELLDLTSALYTFKPEFVLIFNSPQKQFKKFSMLNDEEKLNFAHNHLTALRMLHGVLANNNPACRLLYANFPEISTTVWGNYANKLPTSFEYQIRKLNYELMNLSQELGDLHINDLCRLQALKGIQQFFDSRMYVTADLAYGLEILPTIAKNTMDTVCALTGDFKKCVVLDLDNTLWGGIIGDDGIENIKIGNFNIGKIYSDFQTWIKQLKNRGIILAVCSQNHEEVAKSPFLLHPEMVLKLEDISVFVANWGNKADNIKYVQQILNIGFNSMVFLDDDPYQRNLVRTYLPEVCVPELPEEPADYMPYLNALNLFEIGNYSGEDKHRGTYYREEAERAKIQESFSNETDYLINLAMTAQLQSFDSFALPRVAQLIQRSNQFNLRTIRYSEEQLRDIMGDQNSVSMVFSLKDKFGSYGIISVLILKVDIEQQLFIDTWLMSCRVLKRGVENLALNCIVDFAKKNGYKTLIGEYIPTDKNLLVKEHYQKMGFRQEGEKWYLDVDGYSSRPCFMTIEG